MIYKLIAVSLFFCCLTGYPVKASANEVSGRTKKTDTLLVDSHQPAVNVEAITKISPAITPTPTPRKTQVNANNRNLYSRKIYHTKSRREKIELTAEKVRQIQAKVDKIEARIKEIELQDQ